MWQAEPARHTAVQLLGVEVKRHGRANRKGDDRYLLIQRPDAMSPDAMSPDAMSPDAMPPHAMPKSMATSLRRHWVCHVGAAGSPRQNRSRRSASVRASG